MSFPQNLIRAHTESERLRADSIAAIEASESLSFHAEAIERAANLLHFFGHDGEIRNDDDRIVRVLGFRGFNDIMTSSSLILGGYYQPGMMIARDLLELTFLVDDFTRDKSQIGKWRTQQTERPPPPPPLDFFILKNRKPIHRQILKFSKTETRISIN